ncbi:hypothetical protein CQW49_16815 [Methylosinus trichosporium OB3b]|uniref:DUF2946 domain-containing protein n=1 Tax=Methylosinus trichosporium (strain ATCC 35070 / NCIMB 11131 / UNIQEM 75 / OB3b) TaxID=595536 RepID=A0A2D2D3C0_METT3|nr:hypothetical protein CQW49_16815 [Methylosinus trichosporium OB3b]OBS52875.1 hypothetical protein A8B73_08225 [Methylosinus sp. 3S-1]
MAASGGQRWHGGRSARGARARIVALLVALLIALSPFYGAAAGSSASGAELQSRVERSCAKAKTGDASTPRETPHVSHCALCCPSGCGGGVPRIETSAARALIDATAATLRRPTCRARRTDGFGHAWSSRAPPAAFS